MNKLFKYMTAVKENAVGALVADIVVTDGDKPQTSAWNAKFKIVGGDPDGLFSVRTADDNKHRGIITTAKVRKTFKILKNISFKKL